MKNTFIILMITSFLYSCSDSYTDGDLLEEKRGFAYIDNEVGEKVKFSGTAIWELDNDNKRIISYEEGIRQTLEEGISNENGFSGLKVNYIRNKRNHLASDFYKEMQANAILSKAYFKNDLLDGECVDYPIDWWKPKTRGYKVTFTFKEGKRNGNSYAITKEGSKYISTLAREGFNQNDRDFLKKIKQNNRSGVNVVIDKPFIVSSVDWLDGKLHGKVSSHTLDSTTPGTLIYKGKFEKGCPIGKHSFYVHGDFLEKRDRSHLGTEYNLYLNYDAEKNLDGKEYEIEFKNCKESIERKYVASDTSKYSKGGNRVNAEIIYDSEGFRTRTKECNFLGYDCKTKNYFEGIPCDNEGDPTCKELKEGMYEADTSLQRQEFSYVAGNLEVSPYTGMRDSPFSSTLTDGKDVRGALLRTHIGMYESSTYIGGGESSIFVSRGFCDK